MVVNGFYRLKFAAIAFIAILNLAFITGGCAFVSSEADRFRDKRQDVQQKGVESVIEESKTKQEPLYEVDIEKKRDISREAKPTETPPTAPAASTAEKEKQKPAVAEKKSPQGAENGVNQPASSSQPQQSPVKPANGELKPEDIPRPHPPEPDSTDPAWSKKFDVSEKYYQFEPSANGTGQKPAPAPDASGKTPNQ